MQTRILSLYTVLFLVVMLMQCERTTPFEPDGYYPGQTNPSSDNNGQIIPSAQSFTANFNMGAQIEQEDPLIEVSQVTINFQDEPVTGNIYGILNACISCVTPDWEGNEIIKQSGRGTLRLVSGQVLSLSFKGSANQSKLEGMVWGYDAQGQLVLHADYEESGPEDARVIILTGKVYSELLPAYQDTDLM